MGHHPGLYSDEAVRHRRIRVLEIKHKPTVTLLQLMAILTKVYDQLKKSPLNLLNQFEQLKV